MTKHFGRNTLRWGRGHAPKFHGPSEFVRWGLAHVVLGSTVISFCGRNCPVHSPALEPGGEAIGPHRTGEAGFADAESVAALGIDVQLGGNVCALQGEVHDYAILGGGYWIVAGMDEEDGGRLLGDADVGGEVL